VINKSKSALTGARQREPERDPHSLVRERVEWAKDIIGPTCDEASVESAVWSMIARQERHARRADFLGRPTTKKEKVAIARVARELRRLNAALSGNDLPNFVRKRLPDDMHELQTTLEQMGSASLGKPKRPRPHLKRYAVQMAGLLLQQHQLPLTATRGGKFDLLATVIYGDRDADLFNHLRFYRDAKLYDEFDDQLDHSRV
jgi:hypothetical protein